MSASLTIRKKIVFSLTLLCFCFFTLVLFFEFIIPLFYPIPNLVYRYWGNRPITFYPTYNQRFVRGNVDVKFKTNSLVFKDIEHSLDNPEQSYRVLLLGDSYIEAAAVTPDMQIARVLERISEAKGKKVEVLSMGMSSWGQSQHLSTYEVVGKKFAPDLVITFFCSNDLRNNVETPDYKLENRGLVFTLPKEETPDKLSNRILRNTLGKLSTYQLVQHIRTVVAKKWFVKKENLIVAQRAEGKTVPPVKSSFAKEEERLEYVVGPMKERELFLKLIRETKEIIVRRDKRKLINTIVSSDLRSDSPTYKELIEWVETQYLNLGLETINFETEFAKKYKKTGVLPHFDKDAHWNETGQQWVAESLSEAILK